MSEEVAVAPENGGTGDVQEVVATPFNFKEHLPEDLREDPSLKDIKDIDGLAKSYVNAQKMIGNSVRIPSEEASEESLNEFYRKLEKIPGVSRIPDFSDAEQADSFYRKLGRPDTPDDYKLEVPEDLEINKEVLTDFKGRAHKLGLTNQQTNALVNYEIERSQNLAAQQAQQVEASEKMLREQWGGEYNTRLQAAKQMVKVYEDKYGEVVTDLMKGPAGNNPMLINMLADMAHTVKESGHEDLRSVGKFGVSAEEAKLQISEIRNNRAHPFNNPEDPAHKQAVSKVDRLYELAYPE